MTTHHLTQGQIIDGFRLDAPLDGGGMASFWRVSRMGGSAPGADPAVGELPGGDPPDAGQPPFPMLMKVPLMRRGEDPLTIVGFEVEQMILPRLAGPHVPRFVAAGDFEQPYIVMELVRGRSLKDFLPRTPMPPEQVAAIGAMTAYALHDIHRQHVIHLDIKPSNIFLRDTGGGELGEAVLIDFGLSRHDQLPDLLAEEFEGAIGTGAYIAPEQVLGDRSDSRSDVFSLGVVLYFLATGERPFGEPPREPEWRRRLWRDPQPPRWWNRKVPPWLQEIILRCLEINPAHRYGSAAQLAFDLQHPAEVQLTGRSRKRRRDDWITATTRWLRARRGPSRRSHSVSGQLSRSPIILVAVDLSPEAEPLAQALASAVDRVLATEPGARVTCVNVLKQSRIALDPMEDAEGRNPHLGRMIELKHWARRLDAASDRTTYHVLEAIDPAAAIVEFARNAQVDHIVMGARGSSTLRRYLGSVSAQVVAEAPCTVTVVRTPR